MKTYSTIAQIRADNDAIGHHFFEPATMRFFKSRVALGVIGGHLFITSEQFDERSPRLYTLRECDDGWINTVGKFQGYATLGQARTAAKREAKARAELAQAVAARPEGGAA